MSPSRLRAAALLLAGGVTLGGCAYGDGYGYSSVSVGYGNRGYCDPYYDDCYGYDRYGYGDQYYGWYGDYYYPGIGIFIYDRFGRRYRWNDDYRRYWEGRRSHYQGRNWNDRRWERWDGYRGREDGNWRDRRGRYEGRDDRSSAQPWNESRRDFPAATPRQAMPPQPMMERREVREQRREIREQRQETRRERSEAPRGVRTPRRVED